MGSRRPTRPFLESIGDIARATVFPRDMASSRRRFVLIYFVRLLFLVGARLWRDRMPRQAAALAYQTFLSLVPLLAVAVAVASALRIEWFEERVLTIAEQHLVPESAAEAGRFIRSLVASIRPAALGVWGGAVLVAISVALMFTVEQVTNEIFRRPGRPLWRRILVYVGLLLIAPPALGLSLYYTGEMVALPRFAAAWLPLLLTIIALFLCYWLLPYTRILVRHALVSALVAGVLFEIVKTGFAFYARHLGVTLSYVYGTVAILPLFMVWVYVGWLIFLFGAELSAALHEVPSHDHFRE